MLANYGYADGSGDYFISVDTDKCTGCGQCAEICPKGIFEMALDDYDEPVPVVKDEMSKVLGHECEAEICGYKCQKACEVGAIAHSW